MNNTIQYIILAIMVTTLGVATMYAYNMVNNNGASIAPGLEGNPIAQELASRGIPVVIEQLGTDDNGYTVRGQTLLNNNVPVQVTLDSDIDPTSTEASAVLAHELGHVVNPEGDEAYADNYAASRGYTIEDAYHGVH